MIALRIPCLILALITGSVAADVTLDTPRMKLIINDDATWGSLVDKACARQCLREGLRSPFATVRHEGKTHSASSIARTAGGVDVGFEGTDTILQYLVEPADDWLVFRLVGIMGARPQRVNLLRLPVAITANVGRRLNIAWDERTAVCLMAATRQTDCRAVAAKGIAALTAATQDFPGPKLEGAGAALILCPTGEFKSIARQASHAFGLLTNEDAQGAPVKDTDLVRGSYFFLTFGEKDVDQVIEYCEKAGVKQVMMSSGAWCRKVGHYVFNESRYPNGIAGLKGVVDKLHERGILVGMHTFVSKISKTDDYVTPVPDKRFWRRFETTLAEDITAEQTEIRVTDDLSAWAGHPKTADRYWEGGVSKHREVIFGDEIIQYDGIDPEGEWDTFIGCKRGAWGTTATAHEGGAQGRHYGVDGCINAYIIDQETDLMDEVADRIAGIFNTCGFDMVYFDGGEDVDRRRYNYYVSNFQEQAVKRFQRRPIIHMGTVMTHLLWHSFARSSTVDTYLNTLHGAIIGGKPPDKWPTVRQHIDKSVRYMLSVRADMMPGELGWFGIWPKGENTDGLQLDEAEYLMCKSLGYDVPVSLQTSFGSMEAHVLTPEILRIVRAYEELRIEGGVPQDVREMIREQGKDFAMIRAHGGARFVQVQEVPLVGGAHDVRAFVGDTPHGSVATVWHILRDGHILPDIDPDSLRLMTFAGDTLDFEVEDGKPVIPVGSTRTTLICEGVTAKELRAAFENAELRLREPQMIFIRAGECTAIVGDMALGSEVEVHDPQAFGDVILCTGKPNLASVNQWYAQYRVDIPREGRWTLWARVKYPGGGDDSFGVVVPDEEVTLSGRQVLGNCGVNEKRWHWTGRGAGSTTVPPGRPITLNLDKGPFTFRIYAREGPGSPAMNPRLDLLCLSDDVWTVPTDEAAQEALGR